MSSLWHIEIIRPGTKNFGATADYSNVEKRLAEIEAEIEPQGGTIESVSPEPNSCAVMVVWRRPK